MPSEICALRYDADPAGPLEFLLADNSDPVEVTCDCCTALLRRKNEHW